MVSVTEQRYWEILGAVDPAHGKYHGEGDKGFFIGESR
jgi:hypothetical protein